MVRAIVGANWGDEGKGKITDMLSKESDIIVRFQGGANAGHTIVNDYGKFALHLLNCTFYLTVLDKYSVSFWYFLLWFLFSPQKLLHIDT